MNLLEIKDQIKKGQDFERTSRLSESDRRYFEESYQSNHKSGYYMYDLFSSEIDQSNIMDIQWPDLFQKIRNVFILSLAKQIFYTDNYKTFTERFILHFKDYATQKNMKFYEVLDHVSQGTINFDLDTVSKSDFFK